MTFVLSFHFASGSYVHIPLEIRSAFCNSLMVNLHVYMYIHTYVCVYVCVCVCVYIYIYVCVCVCVCVCVYIYTHTYIHVYVCRCVSLCVGVYVLACMHTYTCTYVCMYEGHSESKERFAIQRYLLMIGKKQNMQVLSHTFTYFTTQSPWTLRHLSYCDTSLRIPSSYQMVAWPPRYPTCTNFAVLQMFGDNFVHDCTRHFRALFVHFANCEMSILLNDAVHLLLQCVCDDRGSP